MSDSSSVPDGVASRLAEQGLAVLETIAQFRVGLLILSFALAADIALVASGRPNMLHFDPPNSDVALGAIVFFLGAYGLFMSAGVGLARRLVEDLLRAVPLLRWITYGSGAGRDDGPGPDREKGRWMSGNVHCADAHRLALLEKDDFWASRTEEAMRAADRRRRDQNTLAHFSFACAMLFFVDWQAGPGSTASWFRQGVQDLAGEGPAGMLALLATLGVLAAPWWLHLWLVEVRPALIQHPELAQRLLERERKQEAIDRGHQPSRPTS